MVKVAFAGGSGQVAREVADAMLASQKHEIVILSRSISTKVPPGVSLQHVDYESRDSLVNALKGVHTLLSFVQLLSDPEEKSQLALIDAAVQAGVKRFAPSEYGSKSTINMPWSQGKERVREYLRDLNERGEVLEYTLFQPGIFLDYLAFPYKTAKYIEPLQTVFDFEHRRAILVDGHEDAVMTLTSVADVAAVVTLAVDYEGKWPTTSGIRGNRLTFSQIVEIGQAIRGGPFTVEKVRVEDLEAGVLRTSWELEAVHHAVSADQASALLNAVSIGILLSSSKGAWDSSSELNQLFPDYQFTGAAEFLKLVWAGQP